QQSQFARPDGRVQAQDRPVAHLQTRRRAEGDHAKGRPAANPFASRCCRNSGSAATSDRGSSVGRTPGPAPPATTTIPAKPVAAVPAAAVKEPAKPAETRIEEQAPVAVETRPEVAVPAVEVPPVEVVIAPTAISEKASSQA